MVNFILMHPINFTIHYDLSIFFCVFEFFFIPQTGLPFKHVVVWYLTHSPVCDTITVGGARFIFLWVVAVERATMAPRYSSTTQPPPLVNNRASLLSAWGEPVPALKIQRAYTTSAARSGDISPNLQVCLPDFWLF